MSDDRKGMRSHLANEMWLQNIMSSIWSSIDTGSRCSSRLLRIMATVLLLRVMRFVKRASLVPPVLDIIKSDPSLAGILYERIAHCSKPPLVE